MSYPSISVNLTIIIMKNKAFLTALLTVFCFWSCDDETLTTMDRMEGLEEVKGPKILTRSISPNESPYFDWEETNSIQIPSIGSVTLPWYNGAIGSIPMEILDDYRHNQGWELVYNLCGDLSKNPQGIVNYLIFYNKFTGILRVYYYNAYDSLMPSNTSFMKFQASESTRLLSFCNRIISLSCSETASATTTSKRTDTETAATSRGWNCFDIDLAYDPELGNGDFSLSFFDRASTSLFCKGVLKGRSEGSLQTESVSGNQIGIIKKHGSAALSAIESIQRFTHSQDPTSDSRSWIDTFLSISSEVWKACSPILGIFERNSTSGPTRISLDMDADLNHQGYTEIYIPSTIPSVLSLPIPGTAHSDGDDYLPCYDSPLGAWNISRNPSVTIDREYTPKVYSLNVNQGGSKAFGINYVRYHDLDTDIGIVINPETAACLDSYDTDIQYLIVPRYDGNYYGLSDQSATNLSGSGQYLKNCIYEEPLTRAAQESAQENRARMAGIESADVLLTEQDQICNLAFEADPTYADRIYRNPQTADFVINSNTSFQETQRIIASRVSYPTGVVYDDYIAKVKVTFHLKEEYGGGDVVSVKTYKPEIILRDIQHDVNNFQPYFARPAEETQSTRWNHRWDWQN